MGGMGSAIAQGMQRQAQAAAPTQPVSTTAPQAAAIPQPSNPISPLPDQASPANNGTQPLPAAPTQLPQPSIQAQPQVPQPLPQQVTAGPSSGPTNISAPQTATVPPSASTWQRPSPMLVNPMMGGGMGLLGGGGSFAPMSGAFNQSAPPAWNWPPSGGNQAGGISPFMNNGSFRGLK